MNRPNAAVEVAEACVPNIGLKGRNRRLRNGLIELVLGIGLAAWAMMTDRMAWWVWAAVALLYLLGMLGVMQAKEKT